MPSSHDMPLPLDIMSEPPDFTHGSGLAIASHAPHEEAGLVIVSGVGFEFAAALIRSGDIKNETSDVEEGVLYSSCRPL